MRARILDQVSSRLPDGRTFAAMEGTESYVDDADRDLVNHMHHLADSGLVEILPEPEEEPPPSPPPPVDDPPVDPPPPARTARGRKAAQ